MYYTLGQRQGLGIGGRRGMPEGAWYVVEKDLSANRLVVAQGHDNPLLFGQGLIASQAHWVNKPPALPLHCTAKIRYRQLDQHCTLHDGNGDGLTVGFYRPQRAITPGQSVVFYDEHRCLGGAIIERRVDASRS
jgi:tRNA-specific 2-thiouridylase